MSKFIGELDNVFLFGIFNTYLNVYWSFHNDPKLFIIFVIIDDTVIIKMHFVGEKLTHFL